MACGRSTCVGRLFVRLYIRGVLFFTVKDTVVERTERTQAMEMVEFVTLVENRGWRWSMEILTNNDARVY